MTFTVDELSARGGGAISAAELERWLLDERLAERADDGLLRVTARGFDVAGAVS